MVDRISQWLTRLFDDYKFVRRFGAVAVYFLIIFATLVVFTSLDRVTPAVASAYGTLCGLLGVMYKFYSDSRDKDEL